TPGRKGIVGPTARAGRGGGAAVFLRATGGGGGGGGRRRRRGRRHDARVGLEPDAERDTGAGGVGGCDPHVHRRERRRAPGARIPLLPGRVSVRRARADGGIRSRRRYAAARAGG